MNSWKAVGNFTVRTGFYYLRVASIGQCWVPITQLHTSKTRLLIGGKGKDYGKEEKKLIVTQEQYFDDVKEKRKLNKKSFQEAISKYIYRESKLRRGHVEFINAAMARMDEFGVSKDLEVYKALFHVFPKGRMVSKNLWQIEMRHFPKQQDCGIDILVKMEKNSVIPDDDLGHLIVSIFGIRSHVMRRYQRMMYWMPKFKNLNPYPMPIPLPENLRELACIALRRMCPDYENKVDIYEAGDLENAIDKTFVASAQSPKQKELLGHHPPGTALFVEGGYFVWLRDKCLTYFMLRGDTPENHAVRQQQETSKEDEELLESVPYFEEKPASSIVTRPSVHEQEDGIIMALSITGTSSKDSLVSWIKFLEKSNPHLADIPVVFKLRSPDVGLAPVDDTNKGESSVATR